MSSGQKYNYDALKELYLTVVVHAVRDVQRSKDDQQAAQAAYWLADTGWLLLRAFEVPASRGRVTRWAVGMMNCRRAARALVEQKE